MIDRLTPVFPSRVISNTLMITDPTWLYTNFLPNFLWAMVGYLSVYAVIYLCTDN